MRHLNLSEWALRHRSIVLFLMIVTAAVGVLSYQRLGQSENPPFTFKVMVVRTVWPGATAEEVADLMVFLASPRAALMSVIVFARPYSCVGRSW